MKILVNVKYAMKMNRTVGNIRSLEFPIEVKPSQSFDQILKFATKRAAEEIKKEIMIDVKVIRMLRIELRYASDEQD